MRAPKELRLVISDDIAVKARKYGIAPELLASLREELREKALRGWRLANDDWYAQLVLAGAKDGNEYVLFGRITRLKVRPFKDYVVLHLRFRAAEVKAYIKADEYERMDPDKLYEKLSGYILVVAKARTRILRSGRKLVTLQAKELRTISVNVNIEGAKKLLEATRSAEFPILAAFAEALGYDSECLDKNKALYPLIMVRAMEAMGAYVTPTLHVAELTLPGTGKTSFALLMETTMRWLYFPQPPSAATLIGDARTGWSPLRGAGGIYFDDIDGWTEMRSEDFAYALNPLLTGMEQGVWKRGKGGERAPEIQANIPVVFAANIKEDGCAELRGSRRIERVCGKPREVLGEILRRILSSKVDALLERIAVVAVVRDKSIPRAVQRCVAREGRKRIITKPSVLRGLMELVGMRVAEIDPPDVEAFDNERLQKRFEAVARFVRVLTSSSLDNLDDYNDNIIEIAKRLVEGTEVGSA